MQTPDWVRDAVFYQVFPDRFAKSERLKKPAHLEAWESEPTVRGYKGGDLYGVIEHLDHIQGLGANALYLNPVFQSASNHRYNTYDYYNVDPMLGGNEALRELLDVCHARGIKVILDGVFNHAGRGFFQFNDILENGPQSPYIDWFHIHAFPLHAYEPELGLGYRAWWDLPELPKFETSYTAVREFLWDVGTYWLDFGIDGWRMDVPNEIDDDTFWQEFRRRCRAINPEAYLIAEIWGDASRWLKGDQFDAVTNYELTRAILGFVGVNSLNQEEIKKSGYNAISPLGARDFAKIVTGLQSKYRADVVDVQFNILGSHDTPRILTVLGEDEPAVRLALLFLMTYPGAPCVYYGDEIGLKGKHDPYNRQGMPWQQRGDWNGALLEYTRHLIRLRQEHPALRRGSYRQLQASEGQYTFARALHGEYFIIVLNANRHHHRLNISAADHPWLKGEFRDLLSGLSATLDHGMLTGCEIPGRSGAVFRPLI